MQFCIIYFYKLVHKLKEYDTQLIQNSSCFSHLWLYKPSNLNKQTHKNTKFPWYSLISSKLYISLLYTYIPSLPLPEMFQH